MFSSCPPTYLPDTPPPLPLPRSTTSAKPLIRCMPHHTRPANTLCLVPANNDCDFLSGFMCAMWGGGEGEHPAYLGGVCHLGPSSKNKACVGRDSVFCQRRAGVVHPQNLQTPHSPRLCVLHSTDSYSCSLSPPRCELQPASRSRIPWAVASGSREVDGPTAQRGWAGFVRPWPISAAKLQLRAVCAIPLVGLVQYTGMAPRRDGPAKVPIQQNPALRDQIRSADGNIYNDTNVSYQCCTQTIQPAFWLPIPIPLPIKKIKPAP